MSSKSRSQPCKHKDMDWKTILKSYNVIPMNQRNYEWSEDEIRTVLNDYFYLINNTNYKHKMGSIILYSDKTNENEIWDGQQRTITTILTICAISKIAISMIDEDTLKFGASIFDDLCVKTYLLTKGKEPLKIKNFMQNATYSNLGYRNIPQICCHYENDNEAIIKIFNGYEPLIKFYTIDDINDSELYYKCNCVKNGVKCDKKLNNRKNFIKHCIKEHNYYYSENDIKNTKIFEAYEIICKILYEKKLNDDQLKELYSFIMNEVDIIVYESDDIDYLSKIFEWENNRGKKLCSISIIKNNILSKISDVNKNKIFEKWTFLITNNCERKGNSIYENFSEKIFNTAILIYNKKILCFTEQKELFDKLMNESDNNILLEINKFLNIVEQLYNIIEVIGNNKFGRLIFQSKKCYVNWDIFMFLLLPIFYFLQEINYDILNIIIKYHFRIYISGKKQKYSTSDMLKISNDFIDNKLKNTLNFEEVLLSIKNSFNKNDISINDFIELLKNNLWTNNDVITAKYTLYFYETVISNDSYIINFENDLEHIIAQKNKKDDPEKNEFIDKFGNLTLFESFNSKNEEKGNRGCVSKDFEYKLQYYKNSCNKITRDICKYKVFNEQTIELRTIELLTDIYNYTNLNN